MAFILLMINFSTAHNWFQSKNWNPFDFQKKAWQAYAQGRSGIVNAPTGSGKTYSLFIPISLQIEKLNNGKSQNGIFALWITPMRSLANEILHAGEKFCKENNLNISIDIRNGDTPQSKRAKQKITPPNILIITPESLHLLLAQKNHKSYFKNIQTIVVDEWHELIGSKRGVQVELAISRLKAIQPKLKIWGISATIGNLEEAKDVLLGFDSSKGLLIKSEIKKEIEVKAVVPDKMEKFPWRGHLGIHLIEEIIPLIEQSKSTLIFTNTRAQSEVWYQKLLEIAPDLAGTMALHHGSLDKKTRIWVEESLRNEQLKVVICTSSLDLGVDFAPVETVIQVGGPKGVSRFMQRAGRSGHQPGKKSKIYFLPTHGLELLESCALREAIATNHIESKTPLVLCFDVLIQYLVTLAVGDGFYPNQIFEEINKTYAFREIKKEEWQWVLNFIVFGSQSLEKYDEFKKVEIDENGLFKVNSRKIAMRHRLNIGTIVSDAMMSVKFVKGGRIGVVEEWFISSLNVGDIFWFAGKCLQLDKIHNNEILVRKAKGNKGKIPAWMGGRMPLSSQLSELLRSTLTKVLLNENNSPEIIAMQPILSMQQKRSIIPTENQFLIESFETKEGHHLVFYPFEGRLVHEAMAGIISYIISKKIKASFSLAFNDYGFELLSDSKISLDFINQTLFEIENLMELLQKSMNATEMARRKFRDISVIAGLIFNGYPGKQKKDRHLQASAKLFYNVFRDFEPDNLLLKQALDETFYIQIETPRLRNAINRILVQEWVLIETEKPTPLAFPIMTDRLREKLSSEKLDERIKKMTLQYE